MSNSIDFDMYKLANDAYLKEVPLSVAVELVTQCNWQCKHCYIPNHDCKGLSFQTIKKIMLELRSMGVYHILLTGGEVFTRKDTLKIIEYARSLHFRVNILSNASLITDEIAKKLSELYISDFSLTIFSLDESVHDSITGVRGSLNKALKGISYLEKYKIPIEIKTPMLTDNFMEYIKVKEYCSNKGFSFSTSPCISPKSNGDISTASFNLSVSQLEQVMKDVDENANYKVKNNKSKYMCETLRTSFFISSNGDIYPCNGLYIKVGNIHESILIDIWKSELHSKIRNIPEVEAFQCNTCNVYQYCERCPGIIYSETNDLYGCSVICKNIAITRNNIYNKEEMLDE